MPDNMMQEKSQLLRTDRLTLHPFRDANLEDALALFYNEDIRETYMLPDFASREDAVGLFRRMQEFSLSQEHFLYGIYLNEKMIGFLNDVEIDGSAIEVGYVIHPRYKNQGYATEALSAAIQELFRMGYSVVRAGFFEENAASQRVMEKCGMQLLEKTEEIEYRGKVHRCIYLEITNLVFDS